MAVSQTQPELGSIPKLEATEFAPSAPQHWPTLPGLGGALIFFAIGFVLLFKVRRIVRAEDLQQQLRSSRFSISTQILAAVSSLIIAYHFCAWSLDDRLLPLRVPVERGWIVPLIAVAAVAASFGVDLIQRRFDAGSAPQ